MTDANITIEDLQSPDAKKTIKIIHISGQLDESNVDEKIQTIYKLFENNAKGLNLLFDLEQLEYMNSKSIGYLTDLYGKVTESAGQVAIANAKANINDILQVVGLTQLIKMFTSLEEGKNYLFTNTTASNIASTNVTPVTSSAQTTEPAAISLNQTAQSPQSTQSGGQVPPITAQEIAPSVTTTTQRQQPPQPQQSQQPSPSPENKN